MNSLVAALYKAAQEDIAAITFIGANGVEECWQYKMLYGKALAVLAALQDAGISPGDEVVIQAEDNRILLPVFWACLLGRMVPVLLSAGAQSDQKLKLLNSWKYLNNPYWVSSEQQVLRVRTAAAAVGRETECTQIEDRWIADALLMASTGEGIVVFPGEDDIAYIQFSSGSTCDPKGITLSHGNLLCNIADVIQSLAITSRDTLLSWMPLTHDMGLIGFHLTAVVHNINAVSIPTSVFIRRPLLWMDKVTAHGASVLYSPNFGFQYLLSALANSKEAHRWNLSCVRLIVSGAESISFRLCEQFSVTMAPYGLKNNAIVAAYGLAEAAVEVTAAPPEDPMICYYLHRGRLNPGDEVQQVAALHPAAVDFVDVGYPVSACNVRICDEEDIVFPPATIGQIQVKGPNIMKGYYNDAAATSRAFTADGWLRTGDLGFMLNGRLVVTGRLKNIIIVNGQNYYPQDFERVIIDNGLSETGKVVACGRRDAATGKEEVLIFVLYKGASGSFAPLSRRISDCIAAHTALLVTRVIPVKKIPKTTSGKVQHYLLLEQYEKELEGQSVETNGGITREQLLELISTLTASDRISYTTDLFEYGISSLLVMQLTARIYRLTGVQVPVDLIFQHASVETIYRYIAAAVDHKEEMAPVVAPPAPVMPLSLAQRRIWMEQQLNPGTVAYNVPVLFHISGSINSLLLEKAIRVLTDRYEILRTSFALHSDHPVQQVHAYHPELYTLRFIDAGGMDDADEIIAREVNTPFQLEYPSAFRACLIRLEDNRHLFLFIIHHILADGWSLALLFRELGGIYESLCQGNERFETMPAPVQFREYVSWQQQWLSSAGYEQHRRYWLQQLDCPPPPPGLPLRRTTTITQENAAATLVFRFTAADTALVKQLSRKHHVTPFCVIMSLLHVLLYRYTQQKDILTAFDVTGQMAAGMEGCAGYTLNTLCLRTTIDSNQEFAAVVSEVNAKLLAALRHQLYPFEQLLEDRQLKGGIHGNPLFKILVVYNDFYQKGFDPFFRGCTVSRRQVLVQESFVDTFLEFTEENGALMLEVRYNTARYDQDTVGRFVSHLQRLLHAVADKDALPVRKHDFLAPEERAILLPATQEMDPAPGLLPVHECFGRQAQLSPAAIAVYAEGRMLTYAGLDERSTHLAACLRQRAGITVGDRIGFMTGRNERMLIAILAILKTSAAYVAIDPEYPLNRCQEIFRDSSMNLLVAEDHIYSVLQSRFDDGVLVNMDKLPAGTETAVRGQNTNSLRALAYVIYTSGSTGKPKGIMVSHASLAAYVRQFIDFFAVTSADIFIQQSSVAFDTLIEEIFPALCTGGKIVMAAGGGRDIEEIIGLVSQHQATIISTTPLVLNELNARAGNALSSLRTAISGGDVLFPGYCDRLLRSMEVYNTYGPSEATVCATYKRLLVPGDAGFIGRPVAGKQVFILDDDLQPVPIGTEAEICIAGAIAEGYIGLQQLTAEKFIPHPFSGTGYLYRSGDIGRMEASGDIIFIGRKDAQVKIRGHRVEPEEIEKVIAGFDTVDTAAVIWDKDHGRLVAFLTVKQALREDDLRLYISDHLPHYMIPQRFEVLPALPLGLTGKIDRIRLQERATSLQATPPTAAAPANETERLLLPLVKEVLEIDAIGPQSNFFEHGGNSLKAIRLIGLISKTFNCRPEIRDIFIYPTVSTLAGRLAALQPGVYSDIPTAPEMPSYPLSPAQQRLWLLNRIDARSFAYNEAAVFEVSGELCPDTVKAVFGSLTARHEALRTRFIQTEDGVPMQLIDAPSNDAVPCYYYETESGAEAERRMNGLIQAPFDLGNGPLYRVILIRLSEGRYWFAVVMHHIITDDWSSRLLTKEFFQLYQLHRAGAAPQLPPLKNAYKDYACWMAARMADTHIQDERSYWLKIFEDGVPVLELPADGSRTALRQQQGIRHTTIIEKELLQFLRSYSRNHETSLFMLLLSAMALLLARYSGQYDMVVGTPVSGRDHPGLEPIVGFFINMLPLRISFSKEDDLEAVLQKVKQICMEAYERRSCPFSELISQLQQDRAMNRSPLFDVLINLSELEESAEVDSSGSLHYRKISWPAAGNKYDLAFFFEEEAGGLTFNIEYDAHLFNAGRIERMSVHYISILRLFLIAGGQKAGYCAYLGAAETHWLSHACNDRALTLPEGSVLTMFLQQVRLHPQKLAVSCAGRTLTYQELDHRSSQLAVYLRMQCGVLPADRVLLLLGRSEYIVIVILAVWKAGAVYLPVDPTFPEERMLYMMADAGARLVIADKAGLPLAERLNSVHPCSICCTGDEQGQSSVAIPPAPLAEIAYVMYTSGSTGAPKGVEVYHRAIMNVLLSLQQQLDVTDEDSMLSVSTYIFDISVSEFLLPLISGGCLVMATGSEVSDALLLRSLFTQEQPTLMQATPGGWNMLLNSGWQGSNRLKAVTCGEPLSDELKERLLQRVGELWNLYGPTEATIFATGKRITGAAEPVTIGYPFHNTAVYILDEQLQLVPAGVDGQIYIGGTGVARGYLNKPALTAERFSADILPGQGILYATGDIGRWLPDGTIAYRGRIDSQVKLRGYRIELSEITGWLLRHPGLTDAVVELHSDKDDSELLAFVVCPEEDLVAEDELRAFLRQHLPVYMIPARFVQVPQIPLTANGKVDKKALLLAAKQLASTARPGLAPPRTKVEEQLLMVWQSLLNRQDFGIHDSFFELGGHSLKANRLMNWICREIGVELKLAAIFTHPTIAQIAALIKKVEEDTYDIIEL